MFHYLFLIINIAGVRRVLRLRRPPRCIMQLLFGRRRCQLPSHEVGRLSKVRSLQSSPFPPARFDADISQEGLESGWWQEGTGEEEEAWLFGAGLSGGLGRFFSEKITGCYQVGEKSARAVSPCLLAFRFYSSAARLWNSELYVIVSYLLKKKSLGDALQAL